MLHKLGEVNREWCRAPAPTCCVGCTVAACSALHPAAVQHEPHLPYTMSQLNSISSGIAGSAQMNHYAFGKWIQ